MKEKDTYQESLKDYRDLKSAIDTSYKEGFEKGIEEGEKLGKKKQSKDMAKLMLLNNEPLEKTIKYTGLTAEELDILK